MAITDVMAAQVLSTHKAKKINVLFLETSQYVCHLSVRRPNSLNILSSEIAVPIKVKFHMEPPWDGGTKVCSNGPGNMTKMATMSIYGKNIKISFSPESKGQ